MAENWSVTSVCIGSIAISSLVSTCAWLTGLSQNVWTVILLIGDRWSVDPKFVPLGWLVVRRVEMNVGSKCASFWHFRFSGISIMRTRICNPDTESVMKMKVRAQAVGEIRQWHPNHVLPNEKGNVYWTVCNSTPNSATQSFTFNGPRHTTPCWCDHFVN